MSSLEHFVTTITLNLNIVYCHRIVTLCVVPIILIKIDMSNIMNYFDLHSHWSQ